MGDEAGMNPDMGVLLKRGLSGIGILAFVGLGIYLFSTVSDSSDRADSGVTLTMAVPASHATDPLYRQVIAEFEQAHPGIRVRLITVGGGNIYRKLMVMIVGGTAPDLMWMGQSFGEFADKGVFMDLAERIRNDGIPLSDYNPEVLSWYQRGEKIFALPFGIDLGFLVYNRKLFREAGLPFPADDWTFDEFLHAAQTLTRRDSEGRPVRYGFRGRLDPGIFGASALDPVTGAVTCDTPEMIDYFVTNISLYQEYGVSPTPEESQGLSQDTNGLFRQERVAIMPMFTQHMVPAFEAFKGMDVGMTLSPKVKRQSQWASSQAIAIYRDTKHPDAAWELFKMFQNPEFQMAMSVRSLPARLDLMDQALRQTEGVPHNFAVLAKALEVMAATPRVPHLQELMEVFNRFSGRIFSFRLSPEKGMERCAEEMRRKIESFKKTDMEDATP